MRLVMKMAHDVAPAAGEKYFIGVDVGTGSVRAGLFTAEGKLVHHSTQEIHLHTSENGTHKEQSSEDIWNAVVGTIKVVSSHVDSSHIGGLGFDATCSLVAVDPEGQPVSVSLGGNSRWNVVLWQDHRAVDEAQTINDTNHPVLNFVGGKISPEMQPPKLLWLKKYLYEQCWKKAGYFFDLADYLTYRATGQLSRSLCCLVCKWTYIGHTPDQSDLCQGWNSSFWEAIGLSDLVSEGFTRIGTSVLPPGTPVSGGLSPHTAAELCLPIGLPVATGIIDAHAGGIGMVGACIDEIPNCTLTSRCALIGGTSTCHMATSQFPVLVSGVWGPYYSVMCASYYLNEGGQSSTGQLIDHILEGYHPKVLSQLKEKAAHNQCSMYTQLEMELQSASDEQDIAFLTRHTHILPDFLGNRSPLAEPQITGMIIGLTLGYSLTDLAKLYLATIQALAYGTRHILETMESKGHQFKVLLLCGGLRQNRLYLQAHADITGLPVLLTEEKEAVLLGSATLAAVASGRKLEEAMSSMSRISVQDSVHPNADTELTEYHQKKYAVFKQLYRDQENYRAIMS